MTKKTGANHQLDSADAIEKIQELVSKNATCFFTTMADNTPTHTRTMPILKICDEGFLWFLSSDGTNALDIEQDDRVQLFFSDQSESEYLTIFGKATTFTDRRKIDELWNSHAKQWFTEGKNDPKLKVVKVTPQEALSTLRIKFATTAVA